MSKEIIIALDAMGGDNAPQSVIKGAVIAAKRNKNLKFIFFGKKDVLQPLLQEHKLTNHEIIHCDDVVPSDEKPSIAVRGRRNSSMKLAIDAAATGMADAVISAGNTGALMAMSKLTFKTIMGIDRPAIASLMPTKKGECVMLDLGANIDCNADNLYQFAILGNAFARAVLGLTNPRIGLLNVGTEEMKGNDALRAAYQMLASSSLTMNFQGFIEGNDISGDKVDVVVTDGFTGNVALKTAEGTGKLIGGFIRDIFSSSFFAKIAYFFARSAINRLKDRLNPQLYNGAMFVGLNGIVVKSHGSSDDHGFANAIMVASDVVQYDINRRIADFINQDIYQEEEYLLPHSEE